MSLVRFVCPFSFNSISVLAASSLFGFSLPSYVCKLTEHLGFSSESLQLPSAMLDSWRSTW